MRMSTKHPRIDDNHCARAFHCFERLYPRWEFSHIAIPVKNLFELRVHYLDLIRNDCKSDNWLRQCQKVVNLKHSPLCQHILKKGNTPAPHRGALWSYVLGSQLKTYVSLFARR